VPVSRQQRRRLEIGADADDAVLVRRLGRRQIPLRRADVSRQAVYFL
jgi:hypothetical protein